MPTTARIIVWVLGLGLLAVSLYLAPLITVLALAVLGLGLPLLVLLWYRPEFGLLGIIFLTSSFVPADIVDLRLPIGGGFDLRDLVLMGVLALLVFQGLVRRRLFVPWWPVGMPLLVFLGLAVFSALYGLFFLNVESNWSLSELRSLIYYAVFFIAGWAITRPCQLTTLLVGLFALADLTAGIVLLQQLLGIQNRLLAAMSGTRWLMWQQAPASGGFGTVRIVPPGHVLTYFMMVIAFCLAIFGRRNRRLRITAVLQFVCLNSGLLLTYTRAQWIAAAMAVGLISIVLLPEHRAQLIRYLVVGTAVLLLVVSVYGLLAARLPERTDNPSAVNAITERALSILTPGETLEEFSLEWRMFELEEGLLSLSEHPLLGVALGASYRDLTLLHGENMGRQDRNMDAEKLTRFTRYIHSSYLWIAVKMGLSGLVGFLWLCAAFLLKAWQLYRTLSESYLKAIVLGVLAGFVGLLEWSITHSHFAEPQSTAVMGLMFGLVAGIHHMHSQGLGPFPIHSRAESRIAGGG